MLLDAGKYLRRGSAWEAHQRLEEARAIVWKLAAVAQQVQFPASPTGRLPRPFRADA